MFDVYSQVAAESGRSQGGLGLGLALVRAVVTVHGGSVEVHNVDTGGSEFIVRLPAVPTPFGITPIAIAAARSAGLELADPRR